MSASILVVDDEESILTSLSSILQDEGYEVTVAMNGAEALRVYTMDPPDLMLLDIWMPEMDGMETLRRVRELVPTAQVMMMSGHGSIETAVKAIKLGAYDYIENPCRSKMSRYASSMPWTNTVWNKRIGHSERPFSGSSSWWDSRL